MGLYLEVTSTGRPLGIRKAQPLIDDGAKEIEGTPTFQPNLVAVISNPGWDAAGWMFDEGEFAVFRGAQLAGDRRSFRWLIVTDAQMRSNFHPSTLLDYREGYKEAP